MTAYDRERLRRAILRAYEDSEFKSLGEWCVRAGLSKNTLGHFIKGKIKSPTVQVVFELAAAAQIDPGTLMGLEPPPLNDSAYRTVAALLERFRRENAEIASELGSVAELLQSLKRSAPESSGSRPPSGPKPRAPRKDA